MQIRQWHVENALIIANMQGFYSGKKPAHRHKLATNKLHVLWTAASYTGHCLNN